MKFITIVLIIFNTTFAYCAKDKEFAIKNINNDLLTSANTVVRNESINISLLSFNKMEVESMRAITVLNERGLSSLDLSWGYEPDEKIKKLSIKIYNATGEFVRKLEPDEIRDVSTSSGSTFHSDTRVKHARVRHHSYPFTVVVSYKIESPNTAFIPQFMPIHSFNQSLESCEYTISWSEDLNAKSAEFNFNKVVKTEVENTTKYTLKNVSAFEAEIQTPIITKRIPYAKWAVNKFQLAGHNVEANTWNDLGKWMYSTLLKNGLELPDSTQNQIKALVNNVPSKKDRAKIVYQYMQNNTRYISIQLGIGGWKPTPAAEVNALGYGDCKALVNYTQALLAAADVPSQYIVVYAGNQKRDLIKELPSIQGNHVILRIPDDEKPIWLECTSQTMPFGQLGTFTDDRLVLAVDGNGGTLLQTPASTERENQKNYKAGYTLDSAGTIYIYGSIDAKGIFYQNFQQVERFTQRKKRKFYESQFNASLKELELTKSAFSSNDSAASFTHQFQIQSKNYSKNVGNNETLFLLNPILNPVSLPENDSERKCDIEIQRSYSIFTEVIFTFKKGQTLTHIPTNKTIVSEFGTFNFEVTQTSENTLLLKRSLTIFQGTYSKDKYNLYRNFYQDIAKTDGSKILLKH